MKAFITLLLFVATGSIALAQFNVDDYHKYLDNHRDMTFEQLLSEFPVGKFLKYNRVNFDSSDYSFNIDTAYHLTDYEKKLINDQGFMISDRMRFVNFQQACYDIYKKDLPLYISSDLLLHALHFSFDKMLKDIELTMVRSHMTSDSTCYTKYGDLDIIHLFKNIHQQINTLEKLDRSNLYVSALNDFDVYFTVALRQFDSSYMPHYSTTKKKCNDIMGFISQLGFVDYPLFAKTNRKIDFSQFKVRGHYTQDENLAKYFKFMMWLGRTDLYITAPQQQYPAYIPTDEDVQRQTILSALITEAFAANYMSQYRHWDSIYIAFTGRQDNIIIPEMDSVMKANGINHAYQLTDKSIYSKFKEDLTSLNSATQLYNSQILMSDPFNPKQVSPPSVFQTLGQRPIIDGFITGNVVYDRIIYKGEKVLRMLPSTFDALFALGNDATVQLLEPELLKYNYSANLAGLRYLINGYDTTFWHNSIFNGWLSTIRALNTPMDRTKLPLFMQTASWQQKTMNTQLASWAELRHDFILYAKQPYTEFLMCSYPFSYVEPNPQFYNSLLNLFENLKSVIPNQSNFCDRWINVSRNLSDIAGKELNNQELDTSNINFLQTALSKGHGCVADLRGWLIDLFYNNGIQLTYWDGSNYTNDIGTEFLNDEKIIADIHTAPTDEFGNLKGYVVHIGTGPVNLAVITTPTPDGKLRSYVGPVMSYYEVTTLNFERLTDEEWRSMFTTNQYPKPALQNLYMADNKGEELNDKISLYTYEPTIVNESAKTNIETYNFPNPFSNSTIIAFRIPSGLNDGKTEVKIYDEFGNLIAHVIESILNQGNYQVRWNGKLANGEAAPSGTYFYSVSIGKYVKTGKMSLVR